MTAPARSLEISFSDFWAGFDPEENFLVRVLRTAYDVRVRDSARLLVFGPYGGAHRAHRGPKLFVSGEPWPVPPRGFDFAIGWWAGDGERYRRVPQAAWNLLRFPDEYERLARRRFDDWRSRPNFCNFVYSNDAPRRRRDFFRALSKRRFVHAPGAVENNTEPLAGGRGAGDWWLRKLDYLEQFRFTIAFESVALPGYTTEKLSDALVTGGIPIYWGNPDVAADARPSTFIDADDFSSLDELAEYVVALDDDRDRAAAYFEEAPFAENALQALQDDIVELFGSAADASTRTTVRHAARGLVYRGVDLARGLHQRGR